MQKKRTIVVMLLICMLCLFGCSSQEETKENKNSSSFLPAVTNTISPIPSGTETPDTYKTAGKSVEEIMSQMTLEEKAAQMVQAAEYSITTSVIEQYNVGSIFSNHEGIDTTATGWKNLVMKFQEAALKSSSGIPYIYGTDAVHGVNYCKGAIMFPQNIGVGAANDEELAYQMGKIVGEEMKQTGMIWNFSPCVAAAQDPRWGRTYESYSSNLETVTKLSTAYIKGLVEAGVMPCVKHFIADGNEAYGTGEDDKLMDRGDATLNEEQINDLLNVYKECIASGANTVMINHGSINGVKLHENKELITDKLKGEMGFQGMVVSDWESIHNISGENLEEQTIIAINAGIDMLMEPERYGDCRQYIIDAVNSGRITMERVDDAVYRILSVKKQMGVLDDPMQENVTKEVTEVGTDAYREVARQLVEKSLVLLKNEDSVLPLKKGMKIFVTGPAANDTGVQCGGWTVEWLGGRDNGGNKYVEGATTILEGLEAIAEEYDLTIITEEAQASEADITLLCIGEQPYAEWYGDTEDLSITGALGLPENEEAIELAKNLGKKTVTLLVAGRNVIFDEYSNDWDAVVMCYLPGSEADGVANVLCGKSEFAGKLAMPWYKSVEDIDKKEYLYDIGYGLTYDSLK